MQPALKLQILAILALVGQILPSSTSAQQVGDAAFVFAYRMKPGMESSFTEGYRRHLRWHAEHQDSLPWLGWFVVSGPGLGMFVDGTFGIRLQAFDNRVAPADDGQDAEKNVTAFGDPAYRYTYRLRRDLGTAARLETGKPAPMQLVCWLTLRPAGMGDFERRMRRLPANGRRFLDYAVYERLAGGEQPAFLVVAQLQSWAELEDSGRNPIRAMLSLAGEDVVRAETEVWHYQADLSYFPKR
jgi:hypothetical protein